MRFSAKQLGVAMWAGRFFHPANALTLSGLPSMDSYISTSGSFDFSSLKVITVDSRYTDSRDLEGATLIPPTLNAFAGTFADDLQHVAGNSLPVATADASEMGGIFLTLGNDTAFTNAAGRWTSEAYRLDVGQDNITITGASPLGVWWGTRTLLQQVTLNNGSMEAGYGVDAPGWSTRGLMLDAGRHYYPPDFLIEMCSWMSFWKQNTFHLHLGDNLYNNPNYTYEQQLNLYATFRLWSEDPAVAGLNKRQNESYTQDDFDGIQYACASRGVTILPEIESPGHALAISQWKPELGLQGHLDLLNISYPETIPTVKTIWRTFLPWFHTKLVSIGADEYSDDSLTATETAEAYNYFVNTMYDFIKAESGKSMRIWGTFPPEEKYSNQVDKNISIQHWEYFEDNPLFDYIDNGYDVLNSDDAVYIVQKYSTSYPQYLNRTLMFHGNPATGGPYAPYIFDRNNATNNPARSNPFVLGAISPAWNDYGPNTSTFLEGYYSWRGLNPAMAATQWGSLGVSEYEYDSLFAILQAAAPGQNLDRNVASKGSTILHFDFYSSWGSWWHGWNGWHGRHGWPVPNTTRIQDRSGNGYDGETDCQIRNGAIEIAAGCSLMTPLTSKGRDYTLSFSVRPTSSTPGPLFTGPDSALWSGNGSSSEIMMFSAGNAFALNYTLPVGQWTDASLIGRGNKTFFDVGGNEMEFLTKIGVNGESFAWASMAFVAPIHEVGGGDWSGLIKDIKLVDFALG